ncbi:MAG: hypothetical protein WAM85_22070 [Terracidiphilus sp.]
MRTIAELNLLLRVQVELPRGLRLATDEFREGWRFARSVDAHRLKRRILKRGWNFIKIDSGFLRSGVGDTAQEAIANGLKLVLRKIDGHMNAVEVKHIELTQYPWFFLARVGVSPYCIQEGASLSQLNDAAARPITPRRGRVSRQSNALLPQFASALPQFRHILISSRGSENCSL